MKNRSAHGYIRILEQDASSGDLVWRDVYRIRHTEPTDSVGNFGSVQMRTKIYDPSTSWRDSCFSNRLGVAADLRRDHRHQRFARPFWNIDVMPGADPFFMVAIIAAQEQISDPIDDSPHWARIPVTALEELDLKQEQARVGKCTVTKEEMDSAHVSVPHTRG